MFIENKAVNGYGGGMFYPVSEPFLCMPADGELNQGETIMPCLWASRRPV